MIAGCLDGREAEIAARWDGLYAGEFGRAAYFPPAEFRAQADAEVRRILSAFRILDEITELPPDSQVKLLRALQERAVRPVGGL